MSDFATRELSVSLRDSAGRLNDLLYAALSCDAKVREGLEDRRWRRRRLQSTRRDRSAIASRGRDGARGALTAARRRPTSSRRSGARLYSKSPRAVQWREENTGEGVMGRAECGRGRVDLCISHAIMGGQSG